MENFLGYKFAMDVGPNMLVPQVEQPCCRNLLYQHVWTIERIDNCSDYCKIYSYAEISVECWSNKLVQHVGLTYFINTLVQHSIMNLHHRRKFCNSRFVCLSNMLVQLVCPTCKPTWLVVPTCRSNTP